MFEGKDFVILSADEVESVCRVLVWALDYSRRDEINKVMNTVGAQNVRTSMRNFLRPTEDGC